MCGDMDPISPIPGVDDYGRAAVRATQLCRSELDISPSDAWMRGTQEFPESAKDADKRCPMATFLGLCEAGRITGIKGGLEYIGGGNSFLRKNLLSKRYVEQSIQYAIDAVLILINDPEIAMLALVDTLKAKCELYRRLGITNTSNSQMDVVLALWILKLVATDPEALIDSGKLSL